MSNVKSGIRLDPAHARARSSLSSNWCARSNKAGGAGARARELNSVVMPIDVVGQFGVEMRAMQQRGVV